MSSSSHPHEHDAPFSLWLFIITVALSLGVLLGGLAWWAPQVWSAQWTASWGAWAVCFLVVHALMGGFEFFFHRYILHAPLIPWLSFFYKQHTLHHALTRVGYHRSKRGKEELPGLVDNVVQNNYPIEDPKQYESSFFPWYSLLAFSLSITPLLALAQWLWPTAPVFAAGYLAVTWSLCLYELIHAVEHWPQDTWDNLIEGPRFGRFWRKAYAFHLRHHADIRCNEGISGVFGVPVYDFIFGTYVDPDTLYTRGQPVEAREFVSPVPRWALIRWLDRVAEAAVQQRRTQARRA